MLECLYIRHRGWFHIFFPAHRWKKEKKKHFSMESFSNWLLRSDNGLKTVFFLKTSWEPLEEKTFLLLRLLLLLLRWYYNWSNRAKLSHGKWKSLSLKEKKGTKTFISSFSICARRISFTRQLVARWKWGIPFGLSLFTNLAVIKKKREIIKKGPLGLPLSKNKKSDF